MSELPTPVRVPRGQPTASEVLARLPADELDGIISYDRRLADAAEHHRVNAFGPS